jgi:hypothetical protein
MTPAKDLPSPVLSAITSADRARYIEAPRISAADAAS